MTRLRQRPDALPETRAMVLRRAMRLPAGALAIAVVLPLTGLVVSTWLAGWQLQPVGTDSMRPLYPAGSLLVVSPIDPASVQPGMPVVFEDPVRPGRLVVHRVVSRLPGEVPMFRTRGDASPAEDPVPLPARSIRGQVRWRVLGLGTVVNALRWPRNLLVLVVLPASILAVTELASWRRSRSSEVPRPGVRATVGLLAPGPAIHPTGELWTYRVLLAATGLLLVAGMGSLIAESGWLT